ncbi:hypothetical protein AVEN_249564-1 [Araneus ventricosus]|uniref:Uncharacterized protein n=1 Tax=Araneus ventricosus TaxID=182803 RepID=A0A4Y2KM19_ARAVE|nr:hypothetical protein AVEN_249564-1 [Araneus ventricosus]
MSPLTLKKSRVSKGSVSKVSLDRRRQERMCSGDALATPHFAQTGKTLLPWLKEQLLRLVELFSLTSFPVRPLSVQKVFQLNKAIDQA